MAAYIQSGQMAKMLSAPQAKPLCPKAEAIERELEPLEKELERLRTPSHGYAFRHLTGAEHARAWELRRAISRLEAQIRELRRQSDPEWFAHWGV